VKIVQQVRTAQPVRVHSIVTLATTALENNSLEGLWSSCALLVRNALPVLMNQKVVQLASTKMLKPPRHAKNVQRDFTVMEVLHRWVTRFAPLGTTVQVAQKLQVRSHVQKAHIAIWPVLQVMLNVCHATLENSATRHTTPRVHRLVLEVVLLRHLVPAKLVITAQKLLIRLRHRTVLEMNPIQLQATH
jgi:hypothetical protein